MAGRAVIVVLCANPAIDVTYSLDRLDPGGIHAPAAVSRRAGGKGTNVARVVRSLGHAVRLVAPLGGPLAGRFAADLDGSGVEVRLVPIAADTRTSVALLDGGRATVVNETGPRLTGDEWRALIAALEDAVTPEDVLVLSGSLPPGAPDDAYGRITEASPARVVVDAKGAALRGAFGAGAAVLAPNVGEVRDALGDHRLSARAAALALHAASGSDCVVSDGPGALHAVAAGRPVSVTPPRIVAGNPTGAGDALTAALAVGLATGSPWPDILRSAVATAAAAVATPVAGAVDSEVRAATLAALHAAAGTEAG